MLQPLTMLQPITLLQPLTLQSSNPATAYNPTTTSNPAAAPYHAVAYNPTATSNPAAAPNHAAAYNSTAASNPAASNPAIAYNPTATSNYAAASNPAAASPPAASNPAAASPPVTAPVNAAPASDPVNPPAPAAGRTNWSYCFTEIDRKEAFTNSGLAVGHAFEAVNLKRRTFRSWKIVAEARLVDEQAFNTFLTRFQNSTLEDCCLQGGKTILERSSSRQKLIDFFPCWNICEMFYKYIIHLNTRSVLNR